MSFSFTSLVFVLHFILILAMLGHSPYSRLEIEPITNQLPFTGLMSICQRPYGPGSGLPITDPAKRAPQGAVLSDSPYGVTAPYQLRTFYTTSIRLP